MKNFIFASIVGGDFFCGICLYNIFLAVKLFNFGFGYTYIYNILKN